MQRSCALATGAFKKNKRHLSVTPKIGMTCDRLPLTIFRPFFFCISEAHQGGSPHNNEPCLADFILRRFEGSALCYPSFVSK
ncbi:hypothetical protein TNIN_121001 [Trichonephila inaurata madagascariensis]|uniref:Uncharacterized protein n=1 Tax=Trichonephila inaurata madagascariensis TaxID=2747483 RepID=A0A8X6X707_9ARAC|nr:hypothetical protein TNIN_121001 [Trichonephila inaurata madagascariensis]